MSGEINITEVFDFAEKQLSSLGFQEFIVSIDRINRSQIRFARSELTVAKNWSDLSLDIFAVKNKRTVSVELNDLSRNTIEQSLKLLSHLANVLPENTNYFGISEGPFSFPIIEQLCDKSFDNFTDVAVDKVVGAINKAENEGAKRSAGVLYWEKSDRFLRSSHGCDASFTGTSFEFTIRSFVDGTSSGQGVTVGRISSKLDFDKAGEEAGHIAKMSVNGKAGKPGKYNIILTPTVAADIIAATPAAANPFRVDVGFSWLKDKIGEKLAPEFISVYDDAILPNGLGSRPFDDEGHPTGRNVIIENGVLKGFIHNTSTARKAGTTSTGNAGLVAPENSNIYFEKGDHSFEELLEICKGKPTLFITSNWYTRFTNYVDGIFSTIPRDGMFMVENGEITKPVLQLRISDKMLNIFSNIIALGKELQQIKWWEVSTPTFIPYVAIKDVNITAATS